ncbi:hypothetical protein FUA23_05485 [Neolewinella aurantiaca]|uniref:Peptidase M56 domain-containing protein n=1 Tax=Neolewinella aurantiaca TaxID=2602767 RepID=A0A5C7FZ52_9BACT|nr:M56 family metallopeptidase [Neolewinella aurantiaca]TXF90550.1 hypothetical protein FUA23_05485 [Neolewinella aurantiaca]
MIYLIHAGLLLSGCFAYYWLLLRNETHFSLNRWVLLGCLVGSLVLPLVTVPAAWSLRKALVTESVVPDATEPSSSVANTSLISRAGTSATESAATKAEMTPATAPPPASTTTGQIITTQDQQTARASLPAGINYGKLLWLIYLGGVAIFGLHFLVQLGYLIVKVIRHPGFDAGGFHLVELKEEAAPYSFWNRVFLNPDRYDPETYHQIVQHEAVHVRQRHSIDLLLAELVVIVQWCNPFAWLYRRAIENNLEFLTDAEVIRQGEDPVDYQMSLVKVAVPNFPLGLTTSYNQSLLEKRITMMKSKKSSLASGWKYLTILPLLLLSVIQFNAVAQTAPVPAPDHEAASPVAIPHPAPAAEPVSAPAETAIAVAVSPVAASEATSFPLPAMTVQVSPAPAVTPVPDVVILPVANPAVSATNEDFDKARRSWTAEIEDDEVCFTFIVTQGDRQHLSTNSRCFPRAELGTLPTGQTGDFSLQRESGTVTFNGVFNGPEGLGSFDFLPDPNFRKMLAAKGYDGYEDMELLHFFFIDFTSGYLDYLNREDYKPTERELFKLAIFGLSEDEFRSALSGYQTAGYGKPDMDKMIELRIHGVNDKYINELSGLGYKDLTLDDVMKARIHGLSADFVEDMTKAGFRKMQFDDIINLSIHGVSSAYVAELKDLGYDNLSPDDVLEARIHGVRTEHIENLREAGLGNLSLEDARNAAIHGVNASYVSELAELGYTSLKIDDVITAKIHGVSKRKIGDLKKAGLTGLSLDDASKAAIHGVNADQVQELRDMGYTELEFDDYVTARIHGITPRFVQSYEVLGYGKIPFEQLTKLKIHGVSADYIRKYRRDGDDINDLIGDKIRGRHRN